MRTAQEEDRNLGAQQLSGPAGTSQPGRARRWLSPPQSRARKDQQGAGIRLRASAVFWGVPDRGVWTGRLARRGGEKQEGEEERA